MICIPILPCSLGDSTSDCEPRGTGWSSRSIMTAVEGKGRPEKQPHQKLLCQTTNSSLKHLCMPCFGSVDDAALYFAVTKLIYPEHISD